MTYFALVMLL